MLFVYQSWLGCDGLGPDNCLWFLSDDGLDGVLVSDYLDLNTTRINGDGVNLLGDYDLLEVQRVIHLDRVGEGERIRGADNRILLARLLDMPLGRAGR